jgi:nitrilase
MAERGSDFVKVAVVQAAPVVFNREHTLGKVYALAREAAVQGAQLVLFPEAFVSAYPRGLDFGAVVGARSEKGREEFRRYWESSVEVPGPAVEELGRTARDNSIYLVIGVVERDGGTLYCSVLFFSPDGSFLGKHRKIMPTGSERLVWGFGDGSTLPVFDTPLGAVRRGDLLGELLTGDESGDVCEGYRDLLRPHCRQRDSWIASVQHIAVEGRCFVLSCNQFNRRRDFPIDYDSVYGTDPEAVVTRGGSCIVDLFSKFLAGPNTEDEAILIAEIDRGQIIRGKYDLCAAKRPAFFGVLQNFMKGASNGSMYCNARRTGPGASRTRLVFGVKPGSNALKRIRVVSRDNPSVAARTACFDVA